MDYQLTQMAEQSQSEHHWRMLEDCHNEKNAELARQLIQKFDLALDQLGRIDYQLTNALGDLCVTPAADTSERCILM